MEQAHERGAADQGGTGVTIENIRKARQRIGDLIMYTPLIPSPSLSQIAGAPIYLKCENLQRTGSFKQRGAFNKLLLLAGETTGRFGVITASSGNHGHAVAYAAQCLGIRCTVVVPETVSPVKEASIAAYGAAVIRCGTTSNERLALAEQLAQEQGLVFVPPYDDPAIVAGQGTIGLEIFEQAPKAAAVFVPVGGGGLISGIATAVKGMSPGTVVIGVEPELANDTYLSMQAGRIQEIGPTCTIADGLRSSHPGTFTFPILSRLVDKIALVSEAEIRKAFRETLLGSKMLAEPSGCVSVAAAIRYARECGGPAVCVVSGGNVGADQVRELLQEA